MKKKIFRKYGECMIDTVKWGGTQRREGAVAQHFRFSRGLKLGLAVSRPGTSSAAQYHH